MAQKLIFGERTSIYQLFGCEHKGHRVLTHSQIGLLGIWSKKMEVSQVCSSSSTKSIDVLVNDIKWATQVIAKNLKQHMVGMSCKKSIWRELIGSNIISLP